MRKLRWRRSRVHHGRRRRRRRRMMRRRLIVWLHVLWGARIE
jgi:hypothetical protein